MKNNFGFFTAGELAKIHNINKRTLHYYDEIGIFSPQKKGDNGYRYYTLKQSMELEYIISLREFNMSINEIKKYIKNPNKDDFLYISKEKIKEIDEKINKLKILKLNFEQRQKALVECNDIYDFKVEILNVPKRYFFITKVDIRFDTTKDMIDSTHIILEHLKKVREMGHYRGIYGSYISTKKAMSNNFIKYNGIFSQVNKKQKGVFIMPKGRYLTGYCIGDWDKIPEVYKRMFKFAKENNLQLSDFVFESGMNECAIKSEDEYITKIEVFCKE